MAAGADAGFAFYVAGSGTDNGDAAVNFGATGLALTGYNVYAYCIDVPWSSIGITGDNFDFRASWRPDCGNDLIGGDFSGSKPNKPVPEPASMLLATLGALPAIILRRLRK